MGQVIAEREKGLEGVAAKRRQGSSRSQRRLSIALLACIDLAMLIVSFFLTVFVAAQFFGETGEQILGGSLTHFVPVALSYLLIFWAYGQYSTSLLSAGGSDYRAVGNANAIGLAATTFLIGMQTAWNVDAKSLLLFWFTATCATLTGRFAIRRLIFSMQKRGRAVERTLILGANSEGLAIASQLCQSKKTGCTVVGFIDDKATNDQAMAAEVPVLGSFSDLESAISEYSIDSVLIADPQLFQDFFSREERALQILSQVEIQMAWGGFDTLATGVRVKEEGNVPLVVLDKTRVKGLHFVLKTIMDYVVTTVALILLFPLFVILAVLTALDSKGPVIHKRGVVGAAGKRFFAYKFRTMHQNGDDMLTPEMKEEWRVHGKIMNDPRITRMGAFLRKFSLDELPQLINVIKGEMSLVGPRMITPAELAHFGRWHHSRSMVKPGMTGLWQISGRSDLSYDDRAKLDIYYVRNHSIWMDIRILVMTIPAVIFKRGAY